MYLFIYIDGKARQVENNISTTDLLALQYKLVDIFMWRGDHFVRVVIDEGKLCYVPVPNGNIVQSAEGRIHHT